MARAKKSESSDKKSPKATKKRANANANANGNGNGSETGRVTNADRIAAAWNQSDQIWPPQMGDKVRIFQPKDLRGKVAKVIAVGDEKTKASTRKAPKDKARIAIKVGGEPVQFAVAQGEVFPRDVSLKELTAIL